MQRRREVEVEVEVEVAVWDWEVAGRVVEWWSGGGIQ